MTTIIAERKKLKAKQPIQAIGLKYAWHRGLDSDIYESEMRYQFTI